MAVVTQRNLHWKAGRFFTRQGPKRGTPHNGGKNFPKEGTKDQKTPRSVEKPMIRDIDKILNKGEREIILKEY